MWEVSTSSAVEGKGRGDSQAVPNRSNEIKRVECRGGRVDCLNMAISVGTKRPAHYHAINLFVLSSCIKYYLLEFAILLN